MKYAIIKNINGAFTVDSEWTDKSKAKVQYHGVCKNLWNASDVLKATVCIVDENMNIIDGYIEQITHEAPKVEATKTEAPTEE